MAREKSKEEVLAELRGDADFKKVAQIGLNNKTRYFVNTGHYGLNRVVSGYWHGGWPSGRVCELFGEPSAGKSLLMLRAMVSIQRGEIFTVDEDMDTEGGYILLDDVEKAYVEEFCISQGLDKADILELKDTQTVESHFEQSMGVIEKVRGMSKRTPMGVFLDSIAQLSTEHEMEKGMGKRDMSKAQLIHKAMRMYSSAINHNDIIYLVANHIIQNIGVMFGPTTTTKGGSGVAFQASVRVELDYKKRFVRNKMKTEESGERGEAYGTRVLAEAKKNKMTTPFGFTVMDIYFSKGIDPYSGLFDYFSRKGQIKCIEDAKGGKNPQPAKYSFEGIKEPFTQATLPDFIINNDILGLKEKGIEYMEPVVEDIDGEEDLNTAPEIAPPPVIAPPPSVSRSAKV